MSEYVTSNNKKRYFNQPLNFVTLSYQEVADFSKGRNIIDEMKTLELDGVIIKNFLEESETYNLLDNLYPQIGRLNSGLNHSLTYPMTFASLDREDSKAMPHQLSEYFKKAKQYRTKFIQQFGVDVEGKFGTLFSELNQKHPARIHELGIEHSYISNTFRVIVPGKNHINIHCGNQFIHQSPEFYEPLLKVADVWNQLSFFSVLEKPEIGGELSVYNVAYDVAEHADIERQEIILKTGQRLNPENKSQLYRRKFAIEKGDLIIFSGGQLWHRVEEVYGNIPRITIGGFIGFSKSNNDIYYWS